MFSVLAVYLVCFVLLTGAFVNQQLRDENFSVLSFSTVIITEQVYLDPLW
jgi:hypothetical protein